MSKIIKVISHNQGVTLSVIMIVIALGWIFGCASKVTSLLEPAKMVTAEELSIEITAERQRLEAELDLLIRKAALKQTELARQDAIKQKFDNFAAITVDAGTVNPAGVLGLLFSVFGIGAVIDNRIKDKVIKNRPLVKTLTDTD